MPLSKEGKETFNKHFKDVRYSLKGIHAAADAFRGTINGSIDHICHDKNGEEREYAVADKGFRKLHETDQHFGWNSGVPTDGKQARLDSYNWHWKRNSDSSAESSRSATPAPFESTTVPVTEPAPAPVRAPVQAAVPVECCTCHHDKAQGPPPPLPPRDCPSNPSHPVPDIYSQQLWSPSNR